MIGTGFSSRGFCIAGIPKYHIERMPIITRIAESKRSPQRRNIYLDVAFAFACNLNVVARFRLREGLELSDEQVLAIKQGEVRPECFDKAMSFLQRRLHSQAEL